MRNLLVEIGVEDLPASQCKDIYNQMLDFLPKILSEYRLAYKDIDYILTNRRIGFILNNVNEYQEKSFIEKKGPPVNKAFDVNGNVTNELIGFLKSLGIDLNSFNKDISIEQIEGIEIKRIGDKEYIFYKLEQESKNIKDILPDIVNKFISSFRFEKTMYWYDKRARFVRPIRWIVVMLDNESIEFDILILKTSNSTYGHRIFSNKVLRIRDVSKYTEILREAGVIVFPDERKNIILDSISKYELKNDVKAVFYDDLLDLLVYMYEYPVLVDSNFNEDYLDLPDEIIINVLINQQKFIPLKKDENIINSFLVFKEGIVEDKEILSYNYKKVVEATFCVLSTNNLIFFVIKLTSSVILPTLLDILLALDVTSVILYNIGFEFSKISCNFLKVLLVSSTTVINLSIFEFKLFIKLTRTKIKNISGIIIITAIIKIKVFKSI